MPLSRTALGMMVFAAVNGLIAQTLEGYSAHGLVERAGDYASTLFHMSAKYHMWHVATLFFIGLVYDRITGRVARGLLLATVGIFAAGILAFCGGMYAVPFGGSVYVAAVGAVILNTGWVILVAALGVALFQKTPTPQT